MIIFEPGDSTQYRFYKDEEKVWYDNKMIGKWSKGLQKLLKRLIDDTLTDSLIWNTAKKLNLKERSNFIWTVGNCIKLWKEKTYGFPAYQYLDVNKTKDARLKIEE